MSEHQKAYYPSAAHIPVNKSTLPLSHPPKRTTPASSSRRTLPPKDLPKTKKSAQSNDNTTRSVVKSHENPTTNISRILEVPEKCEEHPTEDLQFFSFAFNQPLCSSCLLSGAHNEADTMSIKKASETLKHQVADLVVEMEGKLDIFELFVKKVVNRRQELKDISGGYKKEITSTIAQLVNKLHSKEKELLTQIEEVEKNKSAELNLAESKLKGHKDLVESKKKEIDSCLKNLSDLKFCNYYCKQTKTLYDLLHDENMPRIKDSALLAEAPTDLKQFITLDAFKASIRNITAELGTFSTVKEQEQEYEHEHEHNYGHTHPHSHLQSSKAYSREISPGRLKHHQSIDRRLEKLGNLSPENARQTMLARYHLSNRVAKTNIHSPSPTHRPERDFGLSKSTIRSGLKDANVNDILRSGYQRLLEVNAKSPAYLASSMMKKSQNGLGLRDLMSSTSSSYKDRSPFESQFLSPQGGSSLAKVIQEGLANTRKLGEFESYRKSPKKKDMDLLRSSLRDSGNAKAMHLLDFQKRKFAAQNV